MALNIKNREAHRLAHDLARATGTTLTEAVTVALRAELARVRHRHQQAASALGAEVRAIQEFVAALPDRDPRPADEALGYTTLGLYE